jgi:hypothetical protein
MAMSRTISANLSSGLTLTNTADSPVYIAQGVSISNTSGAALIDSAPFYWSVTNGTSAQIAGSGFGVSLNGAGTVVNNGTITASYSAGAGFSYDSTTHVLGILSAGLYVGGGGVSNSSGGVVSGVLAVALGGVGSVVNAGLIEDTVAGEGFAVALATGGSVTNQTGGTISGGNYGILADGVASVSNQSSATITGTARGVFLINGSGSVGNQGGITGGTFGIQMTSGGTVGNQSGGAISGGEYGVKIANAPGSVTNQGTIGGGYNGVLISDALGSVTNQGTITGTTVAGVYLSAGGDVSNQSGGNIAGGDAGILVLTADGTVTNQGLIEELDPYAGQTFAVGGVLLLAGGSLDNNGGTIVGASYGVDVANALGTVTNSGLISNTRSAGGAGVILVTGGSVSNSSTITSQGYSVLMVSAPGTVTNSGLIASYVTGGGAGTALLQGGAVTNKAGGIITGGWIGVQFGTFASTTAGAAGTLVNQGAVSASDNQGDGAAVWMHGPGVVINDANATIQGVTNGTIVGGPLNGFVNGGFGIVAYYQTTVVNYGSIGGTRYAFDAANSLTSVGNRIEMAPGAAFGGVVLGAHNAASATLSTLELLSGASAGTVSGFGTQYKYFGNVTLDNGARWTLGGTVAAGTSVAFAGTGQLTFVSATEMQGTITSFGQRDTIGIDGITVTGSSYAGGVLTLTEASGGPVTLNLPGSFTTSSFLLANVSGAAEVSFVQTQDRTLSWTGDSSTAFGTAANWDDISNGFNPAQSAPNATDTVVFNTSGGGVTGTGTVATVDVGSAGSGALQLSGGATIVAGSLDAGVGSTDVGQIGLTGVGTDMIVTGAATVADDGTGVLSVLGGATFAATSLTIGSLGDSSGALVVSGTGSVVNVVNTLNIGTALGTGDLTVGPGAAVNAAVVNLQGQVVLEGGLLDPTVQLINQGQTAGGYGTLAAGDIVDEGVIQAGGTKPSQKLLLVQGTVLGGGTLTVNGTLPGSSSAGILQINAGGTLELTGAVLNAATTTFTDDLTPTGTYTVHNSVVDVTFADAAGVLKLDDIAGFGGTITTYQHGDSFVITGGTLSNLGVSNGNTLTVSDTGSGAGTGGTDDIIFNAAISASGFNIVNGNTVQVACFAAGTSIQTVRGPMPVEHLTPGMRVLTQRGDAVEIVWIGQRDVDCRQHPDLGTVCPVRVLAGAFRPGTPSRDLWLSPDHAVFVEGVLIPVHRLINGGTIRQMAVPAVTYYHVELPHHDVILAEDLPVESYLDTGNRANFSNSGGAVRLFPDFSARMWEMAGCAPLVMTGPVLERVRQALARNQAVVPGGVPLRGAQPRAPWARLNNRYTYY